MPAKPTHDCPLCKGSGKVSKRVAGSKIEVRDRVKFNARMLKINQRYRARNKKKPKKKS